MDRAALEWHLTANFYPPTDERLFDMIEHAIELCEQGQSDASMFDVNGFTKTAADVVEDFRCEEMVQRWADNVDQGANEGGW